MSKIFARLIWVPLGIALVAFLVANRSPVAISFDPFTTEAPAIATPALPLWFWLALSLLAGVGLGAGGMWVSARPARLRARADRRELKALKERIAAEPAATAPAATDPAPMLPSRPL